MHVGVCCVELIGRNPNVINKRVYSVSQVVSVHIFVIATDVVQIPAMKWGGQYENSLF